MKKAKHVRKRKTMLFRQADVDAVIGSRGLQFKIKRPAKTLTQCQTPRFINSSAKRSMNYQLHAAAFIKKSFCYYGFLRWYGAQNRAARDNVLHDLLSPGVIDTALASEATQPLCGPPANYASLAKERHHKSSR